MAEESTSLHRQICWDDLKKHHRLNKTLRQHKQPNQENLNQPPHPPANHIDSDGWRTAGRRYRRPCHPSPPDSGSGRHCRRSGHPSPNDSGSRYHYRWSGHPSPPKSTSCHHPAHYQRTPAEDYRRQKRDFGTPTGPQRGAEEEETQQSHPTTASHK